MNSTTKVSYDYSGFSKFPDGSKFKYNEEGEICLSTDCSNWAKRLLHNLPLHDYIDSEELVPPSEFLSFPEFGSRERMKRKGRKESVGNYIEDCEFCGEYMEKTFQFYGKLVCESCITFLKKEKCSLCSMHNIYVDMFIEDYISIPFETRFVKNMMVDSDIYFYCNTCYKKLSEITYSYFTADMQESWFEAYNRLPFIEM